jgi:hypothetical protein
MSREEFDAFAAKGNYSWAVVFTEPRGVKGYQVVADRLEITTTGAAVFYQRKGEADVVVHVQAAGTFASCEILSAWDGSPTHAFDLK